MQAVRRNTVFNKKKLVIIWNAAKLVRLRYEKRMQFDRKYAEMILIVDGSGMGDRRTWHAIATTIVVKVSVIVAMLATRTVLERDSIASGYQITGSYSRQNIGVRLFILRRRRHGLVICNANFSLTAG